MKARGWLASTAAVVLLAGCGSHQVDVKAWRAELTRQGVSVNDWTKYRGFFVHECKVSTDTLAIMLTLRGAPSQQTMETGFRYQCPDQLGKLHDAYAQIGA